MVMAIRINSKSWNFAHALVLFLFASMLPISAQNEIELHPDGIIVPRTDHQLVASPQKGQMVYDSLSNILWLYDGIMWAKVGNYSNQIIDDDRDSKVIVNEKVGNDEIEIELDNISMFRFYRDQAGNAQVDPYSELTNTYYGRSNLNPGNASFNSFFGQSTGTSNTGDSNCFFGAAAGFTSKNGHANVAVGANAAFGDTLMSNSVYLGASAGAIFGFGKQVKRSGNIFIGNQAGRNHEGSNRLFIENSSADSTQALIYGEFDNDLLALNAAVGIGLTTPSESLDVNGSARFRSVGNAGSANDLRITANGTLTTNTSDVRLKQNVRPIENALEKISLLRGVSFEWKNDPSSGRQQGILAQDVLKIAPELVFERQGYYGVDNSELVGLFVEALKELKQENEELKQRILKLE